MPALSQTTEVVENARTEEIVLYGSSPITVHGQVTSFSCPKHSMLLGPWEEAIKSRTPDMGNSELCESHLSRKTLINSRR